MGNNPLILLIAFLLFSSSSHITIFSKASEDGEPHFTYLKGTPNGPENWGKLRPDYAICNTGKLQSPINIDDSNVQLNTNLGQLIRHYKPAPAVMINKAHTLQVTWTKDAGKIVINSIDYQLQQCHWHTPSDNTVNGKRFDMELHLVHKSARDELAVVGILYNIGKPDPFIAQLISHIKTADHEGKYLGMIDPIHIGFENRCKYYRFIGSLTTPPCTEGLIWTVFAKPNTVSQEQINALKEAVDDGFEENVRPVQPVNGRIVCVNQP